MPAAGPWEALLSRLQDELSRGGGAVSAVSGMRWGDEARKDQLPPPGSWFAWLVLAGRGFGKSRTGGEWVDQRARAARRGDQVLIAGRTPSDVRTFALEGPGGILTHHPDVRYFPSRRELLWPNGVVGVIRSGANPEEFRGFSGSTAWLDEFAAWDYPHEAWYNLIFGMREEDPRVCVTTTPRPIEVLKKIKAADTTVTVTGSSDDNKANLDPMWFKAVIEPLRGTSLGQQEIYAHLMDEVRGASWKRPWIERSRVKAPPCGLSRVVVAVDPQGVKDKRVTDADVARGEPLHSRETGIVVVALGTDGECYVLEDASINGTPGEWGGRVAAAFERSGADAIVGEVNFGGDMVEFVVRSVDDKLPYESVTASRGKQRRAQPVASLYEQGRVHHVGVHAAMEDEMCTWTPEDKWSPNRMDALVWGVTKLMLSEKEEPAQTSATWGKPKRHVTDGLARRDRSGGGRGFR